MRKRSWTTHLHCLALQVGGREGLEYIKGNNASSKMLQNANNAKVSLLKAEKDEEEL